MSAWSDIAGSGDCRVERSWQKRWLSLEFMREPWVVCG